MLDIHCHILPGVDDGSKDCETSVKILEMMKLQGITHVISTTHFNPMQQNLEEFKINITEAYKKLKAASEEEELPRIGIGSEILYFKGIGKCRGLYDLALCGSNYVLIEFADGAITDDKINDIKNVRNRLGLIPIMAHIERYSHEWGYRKLLKIIAEGDAFAQINASSFFEPEHKRKVTRLLKQGYISFIATDAHSPDLRPPLMNEALAEIEKTLGKSYKNTLIRNSNHLCEEIFKVPEI